MQPVTQITPGQRSSPYELRQPPRRQPSKKRRERRRPSRKAAASENEGFPSDLKALDLVSQLYQELYGGEVVERGSRLDLLV